MREKKWVPNIYQPDDEAAIVKRLEKLAAKGWFLERADNWGWTLRRGKPAQVRYAVTYFPGASVFDPGPTEDQETYADYCRAAGWEFVTSYGPVQYFRSSLPDPVPIETDEGEKLTAGRVSFTLVPRINACGRMGLSEKSVRLFLTEDADQAQQIAVALGQDNRKRQTIEKEMASLHRCHDS